MGPGLRIRCKPFLGYSQAASRGIVADPDPCGGQGAGPLTEHFFGSDPMRDGHGETTFFFGYQGNLISAGSGELEGFLNEVRQAESFPQSLSRRHATRTSRPSLIDL